MHLLDKGLVEGLEVDILTPKPDYEACIQAKQSVKPFSASITHQTTPRQLTHINLWGKYEIMSINCNQYFILMIDNTTCYITVTFLKTKDQAA